jgi:hypothetical protein
MNGMKQNCRLAGKFSTAILIFAAAVCASLIAFSATAAQMQDGQDYPAATSTPGTGRGPWLVANNGTNAGSTSYIGIYAGDLTGTTTPALAGLTNIVNPPAHLQISRAAANSRAYFRSIGASITNGSVYFSFLLNVATNPTTSDEIVCELAPAVAGGNYPANPSTNDALTLHARLGADATHFNLGIQSLGGATSWFANNLANGTDYLLVLQYTFGSGQPGQLFVNPTPGAAQPAASAAAAKGAIAEPSNIGTILFWESATNTSGSFNYDVMRADAAWANVTPATNPPAMRVLFLGNSLLGISTAYSNNIPAILTTLAQNLGDDIACTTLANSGWLLADHATNVVSTNLINSGNFDLVVLQEKGQTPSLPTDRDTIMFPACRTLNAMITNHNEQTMFYETWGQINGDPNSDCNTYDIPSQFKVCNYPSFASFTSMNIAIRKAYASIGTELGSAISPVGLAWARVRTEQPSLNLYILDDGYGDRHPNSCGAYLAACVFYSAIFGRSTEGSTYYSTNSMTNAVYLQRIAAETVLTDPFTTDAYGFGSNHFYWAYRWQDYTNPPGSASNTIVISGASARPSPSVRVDANVGIVTNLTLGTVDMNYNKIGEGRLYLYSSGALAIANALTVGKEGKGFIAQNGGSLAVGGALTLAEQTNSSGQFTLSNGQLYAAQILRGDGSAQFNFAGGQLAFAQFGSAARPLNLNATGGTLAVTNTSPAAIYGNYTNGSNATLSIWLGSATNVLAISGAASLGGSLQLNTAAGFQPSPGQQFVLLSASLISGNFTKTILPPVGSNGLGLVCSMTTTSVLATVTNFTPSLSPPTIAANGIFQFTCTGVAGSNYVLQTSTNLVNWISLLTNAVPFTFTATNSRPSEKHFYRAMFFKY